MFSIAKNKIFKIYLFIIHEISIANIVQNEIFEDSGKESLHPEFNLEIQLPYENGGHVDPADKPDILDGETFDDPELKERILAGIVPLVDTITRQMNNVILRKI